MKITGRVVIYAAYNIMNCLSCLKIDAILRSVGPYLSKDEVATICMLILPTVQHQLKAQLWWSVVATSISWTWFYGQRSCYSNTNSVSGIHPIFSTNITLQKMGWPLIFIARTTASDGTATGSNTTIGVTGGSPTSSIPSASSNLIGSPLRRHRPRAVYLKEKIPA
jgi:hypothetical protein